MAQTQSQVIGRTPPPTGVLERFVAEDTKERKRILWAVIGAVLFHFIVFVLHLENL
jgi:hypothetical protein